MKRREKRMRTHLYHEKDGKNEVFVEDMKPFRDVAFRLPYVLPLFSEGEKRIVEENRQTSN